MLTMNLALVSEVEGHDPSDVARRRAEELRRALAEPTPGRPRTPREFTDQKAREAAEEARREQDEDGEDEET